MLLPSCAASSAPVPTTSRATHGTSAGLIPFCIAVLAWLARYRAGPKAAGRRLAKEFARKAAWSMVEKRFADGDLWQTKAYHPNIAVASGPAATLTGTAIMSLHRAR